VPQEGDGGRNCEMARSYSSWAEFEREEIRPSFKIGFSIDDLEEHAFERDKYDDIEGDDFLDPDDDY
jgi:hypothetical protein